MNAKLFQCFNNQKNITSIAPDGTSNLNIRLPRHFLQVGRKAAEPRRTQTAVVRAPQQPNQAATCTPIDRLAALATSRLDVRPARTAAVLNIAWIGSFSEASVKLVCHVGSGDKRDAPVNVSRSWSPSRPRRASAARCQKRFHSRRRSVTEQDTGVSSLAEKNCPFVSKHLPALDRFVSSGLKVMLPGPARLRLQKSLSSVLV